MNAGSQPRPAAGRVCPADYTYSPSVFHRPAGLTAETLYVVGGIYGNLAALDAIERLAAAEAIPSRIVFNGDFHWFDAEPEWFASVDRRVTRHTALRGNVETEIARRADIGAGCGCAYPPSVGNDVVARSNEILALLQGAAPAAVARRPARPAHASCSAVGRSVSASCMATPGRSPAGALPMTSSTIRSGGPGLATCIAAAKVDVFASTHTCLAALRDFSFAHGQLTIINNGAAGMPNFSGTRFGLVTRIATTRRRIRALWRRARRRSYRRPCPALRSDAFLGRFQKRWPQGTPAYASYYARIMGGPDYRIAQAAGP